MPPRISVVVNTLNEERNLPVALRSVKPWADEIVVCDMKSEDKTQEIARSFGAVLVEHERVGYADPARAFAVAQATGDWILMLDADELVPPPLSRRLREIAAADAADVVAVHWFNYFLGGRMRATGWGPYQEVHARFFKKGSLTTTGDVHDFIRVAPGARRLELPCRDGEAVVHFNYVDVEHFIEKLNRYTSIEARTAKGGTVRALFSAWREFVRRFVFRKGFLDGWRGLYLSLFMSFYKLAVFAKARELREVGPRDRILDSYRREAEKWLEGYGR